MWIHQCLSHGFLYMLGSRLPVTAFPCISLWRRPHTRNQARDRLTSFQPGVASPFQIIMGMPPCGWCGKRLAADFAAAEWETKKLTWHRVLAWPPTLDCNCSHWSQATPLSINISATVVVMNGDGNKPILTNEDVVQIMPPFGHCEWLFFFTKDSLARSCLPHIRGNLVR